MKTELFLFLATATVVFWIGVYAYLYCKQNRKEALKSFDEASKNKQTNDTIQNSKKLYITYFYMCMLFFL